MTEKLNAYAQDTTNTQQIVSARATELGINGRMFKKAEGSEITAPNALPTTFDTIEVKTKNNDIKATSGKLDTGGTAGGEITRYIAYSKVNNKPEVKVYDHEIAQVADSKFTKDADGNLVIELLQSTIVEKPEVLRFQQNPATSKTTKFLEEIGSGEIAVKSVESGGSGGTAYYKFTLDHKVVEDAVMLTPAAYNSGSESPITILGKASITLKRTLRAQLEW